MKNTKSIKIFRSGTDALLLAAYALSMSSKYDRFIELGCGEGLTASIIIQRMQHTKGLGIDICQKSIECALLSTKAQSISQNLNFICADIRKKKAFQNICARQGFANVACVLANPPYYKAQTGRLSPDSLRNAALHEEKDTCAVFCAAASAVLQYHGYFYCIYMPTHISNILESLQAQSLGIRHILPVHTRPHTPARWLLITARKQAATDIYFAPSLTLYAHEQGTELTAEARSFCPWLI